MPESFGSALRRLRLAAGLTQELLAERAAISAAGIAALEAGRRQSPRLSTVRLLCDALHLDDDQRSVLVGLATSGAGRSQAISFTSQAPARAAFFGRVAEGKALAEAWVHRTRLVLVSGEAGVGKTRLTEEFASQVASLGTTVLRGRCSSEQLGVYEPFVDPIGRAIGRYDGVLPAALRVLARVIPGIVDTGMQPEISNPAEPALERRLLFEAIVSVLAGVGPLVLFIDDLHWADPGSLSLISFLVGQPELADVMVVGTVRTTDVTASTTSALSEMRRRGSMVRIHLDGLEAHEVALMVQHLAGQAASAGLVEAVSLATNGNPLYVSELTEHLLQRGFGQTAHPEVSVPAGIRDTIALRVYGLSNDSQALLRAGSVLGPSFDVRLAGRLAGLSRAGFLAAVEDALLSGLLVEHTPQIAAFSHGLVAATVFESMSSVRRVELHRQAAQQLSELDVESAAATVDIARHWVLVAEADPSMRSVAALWTVRAGDRAASAAAIDEAIACYERAAALWIGSTSEHADTLVRLGTALAASGRSEEAHRHLQVALQLADAIEDASLFARAALGLSASVRYGSSDTDRIAELESAVSRLGPHEMVLRPAVLATLMRQLGFVPTDEAGRRRDEAAALVLEAVAVPVVPVELLAALGGLRDSIPIDHPAPLGRLARQIIDMARSRNDLPMIATGWYRQAWSAMELGQAEDWRHAVNQYREVAVALRRPYELALSASMLAAVAQVETRYDDAETFGQESLLHAANIDDGNFSAVYLANSVLRGLDTGLASEMLKLMRAGQADYVGVPTFAAGLALTAATAGEVDHARALIEEQIGRWGPHPRRDAEWLPVVGFLAGACAIAGDLRHASLLRDLLAEVPARVVRVGPIGAWFGPVDHHIGALSLLLGDIDRAEKYLESALVVEADMRGRAFEVRTTVALAAAYRSRKTAHATTMADQREGKAANLARKWGVGQLCLGTGPPDHRHSGSSRPNDAVRTC